MKSPSCGKISECQIAGADGFSLIRRNQSRQHFHESGFPGAIFSDEADSILIVDLQVERAEKPFAAKSLAEPLDLKHDFLKNALFYQGMKFTQCKRVNLTGTVSNAEGAMRQNPGWSEESVSKLGRWKLSRPSGNCAGGAG